MTKEKLIEECSKLYTDFCKKQGPIQNELYHDRSRCNQRMLDETYLEIPFIEFIVTTRCNMSCRDCSNLIPLFHDKAYSLTPEQYAHELDLLMHAVDFLYVLKIHGGEPLLSPGIAEILKYTKRYSSKIGKIMIPTNGSYTPSVRVLDAVRDCPAQIVISQYSQNEEQTKRLVQALDQHNINYKLMPLKEWYDLGEIQYYAEKDNTPCLMARFWSYAHKTLYLCSRISNAHYLSLIPVENSDLCCLDGNEDQKKIFRFIQHESFSYCAYCPGAHTRTLKSAQQSKIPVLQKKGCREGTEEAGQM